MGARSAGGQELLCVTKNGAKAVQRFGSMRPSCRLLSSEIQSSEPPGEGVDSSAPGPIRRRTYAMAMAVRPSKTMRPNAQTKEDHNLGSILAG